MTLYVHLRYGNIGIQFYFHGMSKDLTTYGQPGCQQVPFYMPNWLYIPNCHFCSTFLTCYFDKYFLMCNHYCQQHFRYHVIWHVMDSSLF